MIGGEIIALGVWKSGSSIIGSSPKMAESSVMAEESMPLLPYPLPWSSNPDMVGDSGSSLKLGKRSEVGESAASLGSSQRIQSSKVPKLNACSGLTSGLYSSLGNV